MPWKQYLVYVTDLQVTLSTVHGSKGLEWDYVILPRHGKKFTSFLPRTFRIYIFEKNCPNRLETNQIKR
ncbi:MAG: hypothetical protein IPN58_11100 [Anaerolineales bacterium]|nr:hypothetical protein [Anaerolineales bacterium]